MPVPLYLKHKDGCQIESKSLMQTSGVMVQVKEY